MRKSSSNGGAWSRKCAVVAAGLFALTIMVQGTSAQSIFDNPITGTNPNTSNPYTTGQTVNSGITASGIGRGSGITSANANNRYTASGWNSGSRDANDYFEWTLTPNSGKKISFVSFVYTGQVSGGSPSLSFRSSADSYATDIGTPVVAGTTISLSGAAYQNLTGAITFRLYVWGMDTSARTFSVNDFTFNGTVADALAAEPATQASSVSFASVASTSMDVSWTSGNGANRLVICRSGSAPQQRAGGWHQLHGGRQLQRVGHIARRRQGGLCRFRQLLLPQRTHRLHHLLFAGLRIQRQRRDGQLPDLDRQRQSEQPGHRRPGVLHRLRHHPRHRVYRAQQRGLRQLPATDITSGNSLEVARFTIRDGGASADADSASTTLDAIAFTVANSASLRRVALYDGSTEIAEVAGGATLTYSGLSGLVAADGGTKDLSLRATFVATVTDNQQFSFTVNSATANSGGSTFAAANAARPPPAPPATATASKSPPPSWSSPACRRQ
jgi:hypothetical protein